jgi:hypothetical protein
MSSMDGTIEGASSSRASRSINARKPGGISEAFGLSTRRSRSPISSQIARQWVWSSAEALALRFGMAGLESGEPNSIRPISRESKFCPAIRELVKK